MIPSYWVEPTPSLASAKPTRMQKSITPSTTPTSGKYTTPSRTVSREWGSERSGPTAHLAEFVPPKYTSPSRTVSREWGSEPELSQVRSARDRTIRTFQIGVRSEFLESKENHEKALLRSSSRPIRHGGAAGKERKGIFFQNSGIFARKFKKFRKFQHFLKYRRISEKNH